MQSTNTRREYPMPIYEYSCRACGKQTEILQKLSEPPATDCPACAQPALVKTLSTPGFRLAGSGWYETDFKTGAKKNLAGEAGAAAKPDAAKTDAAPAAASAPTAAASTTAASPASP